MSTILYEIHEDNTTSPVSYYPVAVSRAELDDDDMAALISASEPTLTEVVCKTVFKEIGNVLAPVLTNGNWALIEGFVQVYTGFSDVLATPTDDLDTSTLETLADAQDAFVQATEDQATFELLRYAFPTAPYVTSVYETRYSLIDHVEDIVGLVISGQDFAVDLDDAETGVWLKSPAGNNYKQDRIVSVGSTQLVIVATLSGESGPAGPNSVEHELSIRSRYEAGGDVMEGVYSSKLRGVNEISNTYRGLFVIGSQSSSPVLVVSTTIETGNVVIITTSYDADLSNVFVNDINITSGGSFDIPVNDTFITINVIDLPVLIANILSYGTSITDIVYITESIPDIFISLLVHSDTTDGSEVFIDSSPNSIALTTYSSGVVNSTDKSKFGSSSIKFDGTPQTLTTDAANSEFDMGTSDFTVDLWYNPTSKAVSYPSIFSLGNDWNDDTLICSDRPDGNATKFVVSSFPYGGNVLVSSVTVSNDQWYHIAVVRSGTTLMLFVDGELQDSSEFVQQVNSVDRTFSIGGYTSLDGYIDEIRVSKGIARWTSNFTPPVSPY